MGRLVAVGASLKRRHLRGWRHDHPDHRDRLFSTTPSIPLPIRSDLREQMPPVQDQGDIGSCTANTGCEQMEFLERAGRSDRLFSRLYLYARTREIEGTPLSEDSGAEMRDVMKALARFGVCLEDTWPYEDPDERFAVEPPDMADLEASQHKALFYYRCPDLRSIRASLAQGFPVGFGFQVPANMMSEECAHTGIVRMPRGADGFVGGHAVTAVGHDDTFTVDGLMTGAILCQNHWSSTWGIDGFFWLPYEFFDRNLADDAWTIRRAAV